MHPYPPLANYPFVVDPAAPERAVIDNALTAAITAINGFLHPTGNGGTYLDAVFGPAQHAAATATYGQMRDVLTTWRNTPATDGKVKLSGWLPRFGRAAHTNGSTKVITLPTFAAAAPPAGLTTTLIHESTHGASAKIVDDAYAGVGFRTMPGPLRLFNAPHFDYAVTAWQNQNLPTNAQVGNPNAATGAAVGVGSPQQPKLGVQFQRAQGVVTHARIHAENMLAQLTDDARLGKVEKWVMKAADGLPVPLLARYWQSWINTDVLAAADVDAANDFVTAVTALNTAVQAMTYQVQKGGADQCQIAGTVMTIQVLGTNVTAVPLTDGNLNNDPWVARIVTAILAAHPPVAGSGVALATLGKVDQQYHVARSESGHN
jgi:hypothetical protein